MTLGEFVKNYIEDHDMSLRSFAAMVGMSPQQISNIISGKGNNGKPMTSTMRTYKKIAEALGMDEQEFLLMLNDVVTVNPATSSDRDQLKQIVDSLTDQEVSALLAYAKTKVHQS